VVEMQKEKISELKERMKYRLENCLTDPCSLLKVYYTLQGDLYETYPLTVGRAPLSEIYQLLLELYRKL